MDQIADQKRKAAVSALIRIAILEGVVLMLVIASYLMTGALWVLFVGIGGSMADLRPHVHKLGQGTWNGHENKTKLD